MSRILAEIREWLQGPTVRYGNDLGIMTLILLIGAVVGSVISGTHLMPQQQQQLTDATEVMYTEPQFGALFLRSFCVDIVYLLLCIAGALFALGLAVVWLSVFLRGLSCGMIGAVFCIGHGFSGFVFYVLAVLPGLFISLLTLCYAASNCGQVAKIHFLSYFGFGKQGIAPEFRPLVPIAVCAVGSTAGAVLTAAFGCVFYRIL